MATSGVNKAGVGLAVLGAVALGLGLANLRLKMTSEAAMIALMSGGGVAGAAGLTMALIRKKGVEPLEEKDFADLWKVDAGRAKEVSWGHDDNWTLDLIATRAELHEKDAEAFAQDLTVLYSEASEAKDRLVSEYSSDCLLVIDLSRGMRLDQMLVGWDEGDYFGGPRGEQSYVKLLRSAIAILKESRTE